MGGGGQRGADCRLCLSSLTSLAHFLPPCCLQVADLDDIRAGEPVSLTVSLEREAEGELRPVDAPRCAARCSVVLCCAVLCCAVRGGGA